MLRIWWKLDVVFTYVFYFDITLQDHGPEIADLNFVMCVPTPKDQGHESEAPT